MTTYISFLRGINLGGNKLIRMDALRQLYESLKFRDVRTLLQSGNVVFRARSVSSAKLEAAIQQTFAMDVKVVIRTADELRDVIDRNPFSSREFEGSKLLVVFLSAEPAADAQKNFMDVNVGPEEKHVSGRELYIYFPDGQAKSKLSNALLEKKLRVSGTARNWNTVTKLAAVAQALPPPR